jgi:hypothetical protein
MPHLLLPLRTLVRSALAAVALGVLAAVLLCATPPVHASLARSPVEPTELASAVAEMEQLDRMRVALASSLEGQSDVPTIETMKEVCKPVGMKAMAIGKEHGWQVRQVASRYRNPDHAPGNGQERDVIDLFQRHPEITGLWQPATAEQGAGVNYYRRIDVLPSCMACHGSKQSRPAFVKANYPDDKAFDFKAGDLRGMYAVHLPEVQAALAAAGR